MTDESYSKKDVVKLEGESKMVRIPYKAQISVGGKGYGNKRGEVEMTLREIEKLIDKIEIGEGKFFDQLDKAITEKKGKKIEKISNKKSKNGLGYDRHILNWAKLREEKRSQFVEGLEYEGIISKKELKGIKRNM
jgi:hypothetical protein